MPDIDAIVEELQFISDRLSTQVRMVAIGLLAIAWTILVGESAFLRKLSEGMGKKLLLIAALSVLVLLIDFLQYVSGYILAASTLKRAEAQHSTQTDYDPKSFWFRLRVFLFWTKQLVLIGTTVFSLVVFARYILS